MCEREKESVGACAICLKEVCVFVAVVDGVGLCVCE